MQSRRTLAISWILLAALSMTSSTPGAQSASSSERLAALEREAARNVDSQYDATQQMIDMVFSFGELGYQEVETSRYLTGILRQNGFTVQENVAGIPTGWVARWGAGRPVIALGSDIDGIPQASQKPGVAYHDPLIEGAPGHGEGHNSGVPLNITAALAVKAIMERERLSGTLVIWPGVAEELLAGKAPFVRAGVFKDVDVAIFTHVSNFFRTSWGSPANSTGLVSVEYRFEGSAAHAGNQPWSGRSALDAVELMDIAWKVQQAKQYFAEQTKNQKYEPLIGSSDEPAIWMNRDVMERYRPEMRKFYFDPARYKTCLEQLGIKYPTVR